jgi:hypothetical protein
VPTSRDAGFCGFSTNEVTRPLGSRPTTLYCLQGEVEQVVARDHEQVVPFERCSVDGEPDVADGAETVLVGGGAIVVHRDREPVRATARCPLAKARREAMVGDDMEAIDLGDLGDLAVKVSQDRLAPDREQRLGDFLGQRTKAGCIP